jgi:hypothetical protein
MTHMWKELNSVLQAIKTVDGNIETEIQTVELTCKFLLFENFRIENWQNFRFAFYLLISFFCLLRHLYAQFI